MSFEPVVECRLCGDPLDVYQDHVNRYCECCAESLKATAYVMDAINGREGNPAAREALKQIIKSAIECQKSTTP